VPKSKAKNNWALFHHLRVCEGQRAQQKNIDDADTLGPEITVKIDIGKGDIDPSLNCNAQGRKASLCSRRS